MPFFIPRRPHIRLKPSKPSKGNKFAYRWQTVDDNGKKLDQSEPYESNRTLDSARDQAVEGARDLIDAHQGAVPILDANHTLIEKYRGGSRKKARGK